MDDPVQRKELDEIVSWTKAEANRLSKEMPRRVAMGKAIKNASTRYNVNQKQLARHMQRRGQAVKRREAAKRKIGAETPKKRPPAMDVQLGLGFEEELDRALGLQK